MSPSCSFALTSFQRTSSLLRSLSLLRLIHPRSKEVWLKLLSPPKPHQALFRSWSGREVACKILGANNNKRRREDSWIPAQHESSIFVLASAQAFRAFTDMCGKTIRSCLILRKESERNSSGSRGLDVGASIAREARTWSSRHIALCVVFEVLAGSRSSSRTNRR